jgi:hypothetical protein
LVTAEQLKQKAKLSQMPHQILKERNMINLNKKDSLTSAVEEVLQQEALKGNQHKIDKNHNNKVDAGDFKILRGEKKEVKKEEVEQIDEGMQQILRKVVPGYAKKQINDKMDAGKFGKTDADKDANYHRYKKVMDKVKKEEVEQIDELSKSTLGSYVKSAARDASASRKLGADFQTAATKAKTDRTKASNTRLADKFNNMAQKRHAGIGKAVERLTKEEVMPKTLKQFKEGWDDMLKAVKERNKPQPNGGSGVKQGTRYGGSKQKDEPEKDTDEKK